MTRGHEWSAGVGSVWAEQWQRTDRTFAAMAPQLDAAIDRLAPPPGGRVADIGCGAGATSVSLARRRPDLDILGIDIAPQLVAVAAERGADLPNLTFSVGDAAGISATAAYDMLISRHGVMFFDDPVAAFTGLHAMAKPGAPIVFSCMRAMIHNRWAYDLVEAVTGRAPEPPADYGPGPFAFADREFTADMLARTGWKEAAASIADYGYHAGDGRRSGRGCAAHVHADRPGRFAASRAPRPKSGRRCSQRIRVVLERHRDGSRCRRSRHRPGSGPRGRDLRRACV
jgi:SAM-dependent methyltransferase